MEKTDVKEMRERKVGRWMWTVKSKITTDFGSAETRFIFFFAIFNHVPYNIPHHQCDVKFELLRRKFPVGCVVSCNVNEIVEEA